MHPPPLQAALSAQLLAAHRALQERGDALAAAEAEAIYRYIYTYTHLYTYIYTLFLTNGFLLFCRRPSLRSC